MPAYFYLQMSLLNSLRPHSCQLDSSYGKVTGLGGRARASVGVPLGMTHIHKVAPVIVADTSADKTV